MLKPTEPADADDPRVFRYSVRVGWADCDPARIAYTGRIPYFALEAIDAWWEEHAGGDWYRMNIDDNIGSPFVHLSLDFRAPVTPRHRLEMEVRVLKLGNSSIRFMVRGFQNAELCFEGQFVEVFVEADNHKNKLPAPPALRARIEPLLWEQQ